MKKRNVMAMVMAMVLAGMTGMLEQCCTRRNDCPKAGENRTTAQTDNNGDTTNLVVG